MSKVNPFLDFLKKAGDPRKTLLIYDVDLAIQPSMSTETTQEQKDHMWQLNEMTHGGVHMFTGRAHQSAEITFGQPYAGVYEHGSVARFGHGHSVIFVAPEIDVEKIGQLARDQIKEHGLVRIASNPSDIREHSDLAVFIEQKNTSVALVHTLKHSENRDDNINHLAAMRAVLEPIANSILHTMNLSGTHKVKTGGDAVEIVPIGPASDNRTKLVTHLSQNEIDRINMDGVSKSTFIHCFKSLFDEDRHMLVTGDSAPDIEAMMVGKKYYDGHGIYVSNRIPLRDHFKTADDNGFKEVQSAVDAEIEHHTLTWPLIINTAQELRASMPQFQMPLPAAGNGVPELNKLN